jgi:hypothetical protein
MEVIGPPKSLPFRETAPEQRHHAEFFEYWLTRLLLEKDREMKSWATACGNPKWGRSFYVAEQPSRVRGKPGIDIRARLLSLAVRAGARHTGIFATRHKLCGQDV